MSEPGMLWSAESLEAIEALRERFGDTLKQIALAAAKRDGRNLVTDADVWKSLDDLGLEWGR